MKEKQAPLISIFRKTVARYGMFRAGDNVVAAVSGGPDSVALLHLLCELRETSPLNLSIAHFDHGLRGRESAEDAIFVGNLAEELGLPFHTGQGNALALKEKEGLSLEEACRELRYKFLREAAEKTGARRVALGHTADDQAEEFLLRLIRGAGARGLSGMPFIREGIFIRPLLEASRADILSYLTANKFSFRIDSSNEARGFLRNRIRHDLLPMLETNFNPRIRRILLQTASILREDETLLASMAEEAWTGLAKLEEGPEGRVIALDLRRYQEIPRPIQMRVMQKGLELSGTRLKDIGFRHLESIQSLAMKDGPYRRISLPGEVTVERIYQELRFSRKKIDKMPKDFLYEINGPGRYFLPEIGRTISFELMEGLGASFGDRSRSASHFDYGRIFFPLAVRSFRPGDRFYPDGMGGSQKVKDYFINKKIPRPLRSKIPIIEQGGQIVGIPGWRVDERFKITEKTEQIIRVSLD
ncbi:MAG: tRNA lysidine(34) synthetase TilS [Desulfovibrionales bacterium]|nr:tRNA lysidine(34) synthetase TilS [Desulfovibrionales bacterium]